MPLRLSPLLRIGPLEYLGSLRDRFAELATEFHESAFGVLVSGQVAAQLASLSLEQVPSLPEEVFRDQRVKAIVIADAGLASDLLAGPVPVDAPSSGGASRR